MLMEVPLTIHHILSRMGLLSWDKCRQQPRMTILLLGEIPTSCC